MHKLFIERITSELRLKFDEKMQIFAGKIDGYSVIVNQYQQSNTFYITFSVDKATSLDSTEIKKLKDEIKTVSNINIEGRNVVATTKTTLKKEVAIDNIVNSVKYMVKFFKENNFINCCSETGKTENVNEYVYDARFHILNEDVYIEKSSNIKSTEEKEENFPAGAVGSLFGALIGMLVTILIARLGFVSGISGMILGVLTIKGYELLGKRISLKGIIVSLVFVLLATYAANLIDWAIEYNNEFNVGLLNAIKEVPLAIEYSGLNSEFMKGFFLMLVFALLGYIPTAMSYFKYSKNRDVSYKI